MDVAYEEAVRFCTTKAGPEGIDRALESYGVEVLVTPFSGMHVPRFILHVLFFMMVKIWLTTTL